MTIGTATTTTSGEYTTPRGVRGTMNYSKTLNLIAHNAVPLRAFEEHFNLQVPKLLADGLIERAPLRKVAYALTARGKAVLSSLRTGVPVEAARYEARQTPEGERT